MLLEEELEHIPCQNRNPVDDMSIDGNNLTISMRGNLERRILKVGLQNFEVNDYIQKDEYSIDMQRNYKTQNNNILFFYKNNNKIIFKTYNEKINIVYLKFLHLHKILIVGITKGNNYHLDVYDTFATKNVRFLFSIKDYTKSNFTVSKDRKKIAIYNRCYEQFKIFSLVNGDELFRGGSNIERVYFHETNSDIILYLFDGGFCKWQNIATGEKRDFGIFSNSTYICFNSEKLYNLHIKKVHAMEVYDIRDYKKYYTKIFGYAKRIKHANIGLLYNDVFEMIKEYL